MPRIGRGISGWESDTIILAIEAQSLLRPALRRDNPTIPGDQSAAPLSGRFV
jgi:hypothetical protein